MALSPRPVEPAERHIEFELALAKAMTEKDPGDGVATETSVYFRPLPRYPWLFFNGEPTMSLPERIPGMIILEEDPSNEVLPSGVRLRESVERGLALLVDPESGEVTLDLFRFNPNYPVSRGCL